MYLKVVLLDYRITKSLQQLFLSGIFDFSKFKEKKKTKKPQNNHLLQI